MEKVVLISAIALAGVVLARSIQAVNSLAAGVLVLLVADPQQMFQTGAQLSVLAVLGLLVFPQKFIGWQPKMDPDTVTASAPRPASEDALRTNWMRSSRSSTVVSARRRASP